MATFLDTQLKALVAELKAEKEFIKRESEAKIAVIQAKIDALQALTATADMDTIYAALKAAGKLP